MWCYGARATEQKVQQKANHRAIPETKDALTENQIANKSSKATLCLKSMNLVNICLIFQTISFFQILEAAIKAIASLNLIIKISGG